MLKGIRDRLNLTTDSLMPSFASLHEYGNTSSSTTWYALAYTESCNNVQKGEASHAQPDFPFLLKYSCLLSPSSNHHPLIPVPLDTSLPTPAPSLPPCHLQPNRWSCSWASEEASRQESTSGGP